MRTCAGVTLGLIVTLIAAMLVVAATPAGAGARDASIWPAHGQAAYVLTGEVVHAGPHQRARPVASVAKVMTAYLVLRAWPLPAAAPGFSMTVTLADVADTARRRSQNQSLVPVAEHERLTERQALAAVLLPSANNVAVMLARRVGGSVRAFVRTMNRTARALGMTHTVYTDPSGFDAGTVSTAVDQLKLSIVALRVRAFAGLVRLTRFRLPVAGTVHNTDTLLGTDGFVGVKTGSTRAAGGCFVFRTRRSVHGRRIEITGVVLGQYNGRTLLAAGLTAARRLADRVG
ncbi:D-alanyl-D-alanine carboxypeptidase family protein [uncultured Jatrophihabitans sp.]|uniref:D-alanyl-D-alanine carboxypeptidase family protein n=1 Tax=uncultured Jatrophihabitans sp. TaxID=1610747 RepID=UPI0035C9580A